MNNLTQKSESSGCFGIISSIFLGIFLLALFVGNIYIFAPLTERVLQESFCKSGTIHNESSGKRRKTTCVDKKTGEKIDVSIWQIIACCPGGFVFIFVVVLMMTLNIIRHRAGKRRSNSELNFRNFRS